MQINSGIYFRPTPRQRKSVFLGMRQKIIAQDFMLELTNSEIELLVSQSVIPSKQYFVEPSLLLLQSKENQRG